VSDIDLVFIVKDSYKNNEIVIETNNPQEALEMALDVTKCKVPMLEVRKNGELIDGSGYDPKTFKKIINRYS
jgi:hypothetical protein